MRINKFLGFNKFKLENGKQLGIRIGLIANEAYWLYFHEWFDMPNGFEWNAVTINPSNWYAISYSLDTYRLLPKPYPTDCIDYHIRTEFLSQKDCIRKCLIRESIDKCNAISNDTKIYEWEIRSLDGKHSDDNCSGNVYLKNKCNKICRHKDCVKSFYKPYVITSLPNNGKDANNNKDAQILISLLMEPKRKYCYYPKIETIEFLCYLASVLSLWFGFSFLSVYTLFEKLQNWIQNKFKSKFHFSNNAEKKTFSHRYGNRF
jgi:hypothetical protein